MRARNYVKNVQLVSERAVVGVGTFGRKYKEGWPLSRLRQRMKSLPIWDPDDIAVLRERRSNFTSFNFVFFSLGILLTPDSPVVECC